MDVAFQAELSAWSHLLSQLGKRNPVLVSHLAQWQNASLKDYVDYLWHALSRNMQCPVNPSFFNLISSACRSRFNDDTKLRGQLTDSPVVLSAHHTAPLFHPLAIQSLLVASAGRKAPAVVPVLSTDWVPMDNLFYPRGLLLPGKSGLQQINLFPKSCKKKMVSHMEPFTTSDVSKALSAIQKKYRSGDIDSKKKKSYELLLGEFYSNSDVLALQSYAEQCALLNHKMCQQAIPDVEFLFFNVSELAIDLLITELENNDSLMYRLLFDKNCRDNVVEKFDGVSGCWNRKAGQGSILFWQCSGSKMVPFLSYDGCHLNSEQGRLVLKPESVMAGLREGSIIPGMCLVFSLLMFSMGLVCVGGMRQITYTKAIREILVDVVDSNTEVIARHPVESFVAGLYARTHLDGSPVLISELLDESVTLRKRTFADAVLAASDELLALS
ncbi:hypothetical protein [Teredinibacter haidensis]|uniref:hypothetical protein n=1 Tax=Teredinibacter haidensis TaxID=2731755 RepID=UPI0009490209|nr:hypothetical protein [Teredinibacter haidensis]